MEFEKIVELSSANCTDVEIQQLLNVLKRNEAFQQMESGRIKKLESEMNYYMKMTTVTEKQFCHCSICNSSYIPIINPLCNCQHCQREICANCKAFLYSTNIVNLCKLCYQEWLKQVKSGKWFLETAKIENRLHGILEIKEKLSTVQNEIKNQIKMKQEIDQSNLQRKESENHSLKNGKKNIDIQQDDDGTLSICDSNTTVSADSLFTTPQERARFNAMRLNQILVDECNGDRYSPNSISPCSDKCGTINSKKRRSKFVPGTLKQSQKSSSTNDIQRVNGGPMGNLVKTQLRASSNSYGSCTSSEILPNDFIVQGEIQMKIEYHQVPTLLKVHIIQCRNLSTVNKNENTTNPYVKLYLLPDKSSSSKRKTTIKKNDPNPLYDEELTYHIDKLSLGERTLSVSVWHHENVKTNIFMGELNIPLNNIKFNDPQECWYSLKTRENVPKIMSLYRYRGEILIGLQFFPNIDKNQSNAVSQYKTGKFNIFIKNGKHIGNDKNIPNSFIRCSMTLQNIEICKKETKVIHKTTNPIWDEVFIFKDIEKDDLKDTEIILTIYNKKLRKNEALGLVLLTNTCIETGVPACREKDVLLWRKFLESPNQSIIEDYLPIRSVTQ